MLEQRIERQFIDSADLKYQSAQILSKSIAAAAQALLVCVTNGGKVLACGSGGCAPMAQYFAAAFIGPFERERPELAAVALAPTVGAVAHEGASNAVFARQVRALGSSGDVLLVLSVDGNCTSVGSAIAAAHEREMVVIGLTGLGGGKMAGWLRDTDVHVAVPHERAARIMEVQLLVLHCLCDGVDTQLLGDQEETTI